MWMHGGLVKRRKPRIVTSYSLPPPHQSDSHMLNQLFLPRIPYRASVTSEQAKTPPSEGYTQQHEAYTQPITLCEETHISPPKNDEHLKWETLVDVWIVPLHPNHSSISKAVQLAVIPVNFITNPSNDGRSVYAIHVAEKSPSTPKMGEEEETGIRIEPRDRKVNVLQTEERLRVYTPLNSVLASPIHFPEEICRNQTNLVACQRIPLILRALPHDLFVAVVGAGITHDTDIDQCCDTLAQLVIAREEQTLAGDFILRFQRADEDDKEYAKKLQLLAERTFRGCPPNKVANWVTVQFKHGVQSPALIKNENSVRFRLENDRLDS
ncbi:hypothetical protein EGR_06405 [Echinococcus granulosus]|uniref:DUF5726 domain-containing protein n=1 Tax=Echinococcus granulosus TaxID=6210 RepID=W6UYS4_ECHGR|nr:hypothetical protein EGR_06405 [Echinococcus granulosus]EUB58734.1 hypothetical protein EGR_06405 [Echinococcus granulosus]